MQNRLIDLILGLLAISLLPPCPVLPVFTEVVTPPTLASITPDRQAREGDTNSSLIRPNCLHLEPASTIPSTLPNDEYLDKQWALNKLQAVEAWQITSGGEDILIAVLDTGIDQTHEDLMDKVAASVNFTDSPTASDLHGHGTHIAGIIAATANNGIGIVGLAPNSRLLNVKVADRSGMVEPSKIAEGIMWAVDNGAKVINMSFTLSEPAQAVEDAVDYAWSKGIVVVAASGNYVGDRPTYPACYCNCLAVAATDASDCVGSWSSRDDSVHVAAPGVNIYSTLPDNCYGYKSGTSMAAAYVAGVAGLLFSVVCDANDSGLLNDEVRDAIENNCDEIGILGIGGGCTGECKDDFVVQDEP